MTFSGILFWEVLLKLLVLVSLADTFFMSLSNNNGHLEMYEIVLRS